MDKFQLLADTYSLEMIMEQNDLEPRDVLELLYKHGYIDIEDYFYEDEEEFTDGD